MSRLYTMVTILRSVDDVCSCIRCCDRLGCAGLRYAAGPSAWYATGHRITCSRVSTATALPSMCGHQRTPYPTRHTILFEAIVAVAHGRPDTFSAEGVFEKEEAHLVLVFVTDSRASFE